MNSCPKSIHIFIYHQAPESTFSVLLGMLKDHIIQGCSYFWIFQAMRPPEQQLPTSESSKRRGQFDHSSSTMPCYHDDLAPPMCSRYHRPIATNTLICHFIFGGRTLGGIILFLQPDDVLSANNASDLIPLELRLANN